MQENVRRWERADLPWVLPDYIQDFSQDLAANKAWIFQGGPTPLVTVGAAVKGLLSCQSEGESKVVPSDEDLPTPRCLVPKVVLLDDIKHILNKGVWAVTPAKHQGGQIFIEVHCPPMVQHADTDCLS